MSKAVTVIPLTGYASVAYDAEFATLPARAIDVEATGDLFLEDMEGNTLHWTIGASAPLPFRIYVGFRKIIGDGSGSVGDGSTGTDIALADLIPLH